MAGKVGVDYPIVFAVRDGTGQPVTGLTNPDFAIRVRNPGNTADETPSVTEVGNGRYRFVVGNAFTTTHGAGVYGVTIEVDDGGTNVDMTSDSVEFFAVDLDDLDTSLTAIDAAIAALQDLSIADVQTALTNQGYTVARASELSEILDLTKNRRYIDFTVTPRQYVVRNRTDTGEILRVDLTTYGGEPVAPLSGAEAERGHFV